MEESEEIVIKEKLEEVSLLLEDGKSPSVTVRELLWWVLAQRRGWYTVSLIKQELAKRKLKTVPDFEGVFIDATVHFERDEPSSGDEPTVDNGDAQTEQIAEGDFIISGVFASSDPTYRISKLEAASTAPVYVAPDASLACAITIMLSNGFSQLPVMTNERDVKGVISWSSIGVRFALDKGGKVVRELMEPHQEIRASDSIFAAITVVNQHDYVLVRGDDRKITGIITAADLNNQFQKLAEPFLLLGEIENQIRRLIDNRFTAAELEYAKNPADTEREISSVADLTFGEYVKLLENPEKWNKLQLLIDRERFIEKLEQVRRIRNDVMHFDPDPVPQKQQKLLRDFAQFLQRIHSLR
ncbi:MAG TPA: CBS domain-containing protein [Hymenobacter sp.]